MTLGDMTWVAAPVVLRGWALVAAAEASIGSVAVFLGFGAAATVSLPVVIAGGLVATAAVSLGVYNLTGFKERGALITNPSTCRIVAHLQQTGAARDLAMTLVNNAPAVLQMLGSPVNLISAAATFMQNRAILRGIETLRVMQMGGLALTGLDIGISLAGFAITQARLKEISRGLADARDQLTRMAARIEDLFDDTVRGELVELETVCQQVDDAWVMADPGPVWRAADGVLSRLEGRFFDRAAQIIDNQGLPAWQAVERFLDAALLASATLVSVRTAMREVEAARKAAERGAARLQRLTGEIGLRQMLGFDMSREGVLSRAGQVDALTRLQPSAVAQVTRLRQREEVTASSGLALQRLLAAGVDGRAYLQRMRDEKDVDYAVILPDLELTSG
ncbi:MAG: hypothetical protein H7317_11860 [Pseudorhodobacter sp.]|nr:hypothetical protein [Pseudorhodobacter sp.]